MQIFIHSASTGWRLEVLDPPQDASVRAGTQVSFSCTLSEAVPVGEATWYINGAAIQPDDADWKVTTDGSHHALMLNNAQPQHAGEVTFAARDAVASARLSVLGEWLVEIPCLQFGSGAHPNPSSLHPAHFDSDGGCPELDSVQSHRC